MVTMRRLSKLTAIDHWIFFTLQTLSHQRCMVPLSRCVSMSADGPGYCLAGLAAWFAQKPWLTLALMAGFALERTVYFICKPTFKRARPAAALADFRAIITPSDQFSFPSGHTSGAFLFATLCSSCFPSLLPVLFAWALAVGVSRVLLGVHFLSDVAAGALLGFGIAQLVIYLGIPA